MSGGVLARLAELGLELPAVAAPVAAYVPAVVDGDHVWVSGQLPFVDGVLPVTGLVGDGDGLVPPDVAAAQAARCALNALAALASVADLDRVRVVRVTGYVAVAPGFTAIPAVVNGASTLLGDVLGEAGRHARAAVGVAGLPLRSPVEVDLVARLG